MPPQLAQCKGCARPGMGHHYAAGHGGKHPFVHRATASVLMQLRLVFDQPAGSIVGVPTINLSGKASHEAGGTAYFSCSVDALIGLLELPRSCGGVRPVQLRSARFKGSRSQGGEQSGQATPSYPCKEVLIQPVHSFSVRGQPPFHCRP